MDEHNISHEEAMYGSKLSPIARGTVSELLAAADLMMRGYVVFKAVNHDAPCDLIAMKNGRFLTIEVRSGGEYSTSGRTDRVDPDHFAIVNRARGTVAYHPYLPEDVAWKFQGGRP